MVKLIGWERYSPVNRCSMLHCLIIDLVLITNTLKSLVYCSEANLEVETGRTELGHETQLFPLANLMDSLLKTDFPTTRCTVVVAFNMALCCHTDILRGHNSMALNWLLTSGK